MLLLTGTALFAACPVGFEAASFRLSAPAENPSMRMRGGFGTSDPGRIAWEEVALGVVIANAYGVDFDQVTGSSIPAQVRYDLSATFAPVKSAEEFQAMLRGLLAERLHLAIHHETPACGGEKRAPREEPHPGSGRSG
jgi:uncharacterized protein (TIGR03435 family)